MRQIGSEHKIDSGALDDLLLFLDPDQSCQLRRIRCTQNYRRDQNDSYGDEGMFVSKS